MIVPRPLLIALALTGVACATHAKSTVSLFGVVDLSVQSLQVGGLGQTSRMAVGSDQTSRVGISGDEDLGSGIRTGFWLEGGFTPNSGQGVASNLNNQTSGASGDGGFSFDRRATVSLITSVGEFRVGRDFTPTYWNISQADPFSANGLGSSRLLLGAGDVTAVNFVRTSNTVGYHLPSGLGGLYGQAMLAAGNNSTSAPHPNDGNYVGWRLGVVRKFFDVAVAAGRTQYATGGFEVKNLMVAYEMGKLRFSALKNRSQILSGNDSSSQNDMLIGLSFDWDGGQLNFSRIRSNLSSGVGVGSATLTGLGYTRSITKRTAAYVHWSQIRNEGQASFGYSGTSVPGGSASHGWEIGVRHAF